jgi:PmbA protein
MSQQTEIVEQIVEHAMPRAQAAQALLTTQEMSEVNFENDHLKSAESSQRTEIEVRVIVDGKVGISRTSNESDVSGVVQRALDAAAFGSPAYYEMPGAQPLPLVKSHDPAILALAKPEMIGIGQGMVDMLKAYNPEILVAALVSRNLRQVAFANSAGASYFEAHTVYTAGTSAQLVRGTDLLFVEQGLSQKQRSLDTEEIAESAIEQFRMAECTAAVQSGEMPVIFTPKGLIALLLSLGMGLDGKFVHLGASPLSKKLGQAIADPRFTIIDDPFVDFGPNSSAFDEEGVRRQVTPLVENGVLRNFIYDLDTSGRAGAKPTGHGPNRRFTNLVISPGDMSFTEMIRGVKNGLLVNDYLGLGQGNPINGEFSANVLLGYKIENGAIVGRVKDVMLAGNTYTALKNIISISQEREWISGPYINWPPGLLPYILVGGLSVVAK